MVSVLKVFAFEVRDSSNNSLYFAEKALKMANIYTRTLFALTFSLVILAQAFAQIPNFGRCPSYEPMVGFDRERFLGTWYEAERYFTVTELASRCIAANYERRSDGKIYVSNEITNRL